VVVQAGGKARKTKTSNISQYFAGDGTQPILCGFMPQT
jgi:hypothetical protein